MSNKCIALVLSIYFGQQVKNTCCFFFLWDPLYCISSNKKNVSDYTTKTLSAGVLVKMMSIPSDGRSILLEDAEGCVLGPGTGAGAGTGAVNENIVVDMGHL